MGDGLVQPVIASRYRKVQSWLRQTRRGFRVVGFEAALVSSFWTNQKSALMLKILLVCCWLQSAGHCIDARGYLHFLFPEICLRGSDLRGNVTYEGESRNKGIGCQTCLGIRASAFTLHSHHFLPLVLLLCACATDACNYWDGCDLQQNQRGACGAWETARKASRGVCISVSMPSL